MPWIENDREAFLLWLSVKVDTPYRWGGNEVKDGGFDCSGLTNGGLRKLGITHQDLRATDLAHKFPRVELQDLEPGDLLFWKNDNGSVVHVEAVWYINKEGTIYSIGARGGGPWTTTLTAAQRKDARVKVRKAPIGWAWAVNPFGD
jgi:cell wall-associated NlpC family hydrolase